MITPPSHPASFSAPDAPDDAWLVAVDLQNVFRDEDSPWTTPRFDSAAETTVRLAQAFGGRAVFTRFVAPSHPAGAWETYYDEFPFALQPSGSRAYRLTDRVAGVAAAHHTVSETTFGKWGPQLAAITGPDPHLVVCGVATDCCVLSTVLAAADAGAHVTVVTDACAGSSDEAHQKALDVMDLYAPLVGSTTTDELLATRARG